MKTTDELEQETEKADRAFDDCRARLFKDPEYLRTAAAADAAYEAYTKSKGFTIPRNLTVSDAPRPTALRASDHITRISTIF